MKKTLTIVLLFCFNLCWAQSLTILPNGTSATSIDNLSLKGYKSINTGKSSILEMKNESSNSYIQTTTNTPISFSVNDGASLMSLGTNGYLGLGTTMPSERLEIINGRIRLNGEKSIGNPSSISFSTEYNSSPYKINMKDNDNLSISSINNSDIFIMNVNNGNVGINTMPGNQALTLTKDLHNTQYENNQNKKRNLLSDLNGTLTIAPDSKLIVTPWSFIKFGTPNVAQYYSIVNNFGSFSSLRQYAPSTSLHLPNGTKITDLIAKVIDNSSTTYINISVLAVSALTGSTLSVGSFNSKALGNSTSAQTISGSANHWVDNDTYFYICEILCLDATTNASSDWPSNLKIGNLQFNYNY